MSAEKTSPEGADYDLIVLGSGAAGLACAVTAAWHGMRVALIEKTSEIGGTSAWSGGWIWAPRNPVVVRGGKSESEDAPRMYLEAVLGNHYDAARVEAFLHGAPEMVAFFEANTALQFEPGLAIPDTYGHLPGAGTGGRSVIARPFDGRDLGTSISLLRKPPRETTFCGMTIQSGPDLKAFMTATRSLSSLVHVTRRTVRHFLDLARHGRGMSLRNGNALVARLLRSALDLAVEIRVDTRVAGLLINEGRVSGVRLSDDSVLRARCGVVLACGGFPHDADRRRQVFARDREHQALAVPSATGDGLKLAEEVGALVKTSTARPAAFCPVSEVPWADGTTGRFPHIIDRGKPGVIGVLANGRRFCNEGLGYHDYVEALLGAVSEDVPAESWLVCDHRVLRRFGLGVVRPAPVPFRQWIKRGYLKTGRTIEDLARSCGIDAEGLERTISDWNRSARKGEDPEFHRGTTPYMRLQGDPEQMPNPCVAPISKAPFYAVKVVPGSFGTFAGLATDEHARVLREDLSVIDGLYAAGTDSASVFGGFYPAGGINLGPALTFGYIAGRHAAARDAGHDA
ncbi:FAD-dependent oxidoreductase [Rhodobacterales bacterium]|nr:FAD-dependent oxidoreductase [Rhodobacterales bacterium]